MSDIFDDEISKEAFEVICLRTAKKYKQIEEIVVEGANVYITVRSHTKLTAWKCRFDFDDNGCLSGRKWIYSDNMQSMFPKYFANAITDCIINYPACVDATFENELERVQYKNKQKEEQREEERRQRILDEERKMRQMEQEWERKQQQEEAIIHQRMVEQKRKQRGKCFLIILSLLLVIVTVRFFVNKYNESIERHLANGEIKAKVSSTELAKMTVDEAKAKLHVSGFTNVETEKIKDVVLGIINKKGEIDSISINGDKDFSGWDWFPKDSEVIIYYHTGVFGGT